MSARNSKSTATWGNGGTQASAEARKRLLRDLKELHQHPLENVAAAPVDDANMFIWHANMRGSDPAMGEVFHLILEFPPTYPSNPPSVKLCTPLPHPNVFPDKYNTAYSLCMDMLEEGQWATDLDKNVKYSGWSSAYSVQLILVQLQSFLLDAQLQYASHKGSLVTALAAAKSFSCKSCPHKSSSPFPSFATPQQMQAKTCVRVVKFVPRVRPPHMTTTGIINRAIRRAVTGSAQTPPIQPPKQKVPTTPAIPAPPVWQVVQSRRANDISSTTTLPNNNKSQNSNNNNSNKSQNKTKNQNKTTTVKDNVAKGANVSRQQDVVLDGPQTYTRPRKSRKPKTPKNPTASPRAEPANTPIVKKDYVKIMLQEAEARERMLKERENREKEERKQERMKEQRERNKESKKKKNKASSTKPATTTTATTTTATPSTPTTTTTTATSKNTVNFAPVPNRKSKPPTQQPLSTQTTANPVENQPIPQQNKKQNATPTISYLELQKTTRPNHSKLGNFANIPPDSLLYILSLLPVSQVGSLAQVSSDMRKLSEDGLLWRALFSRHYPKSRLTATNVAEWKFVFYREVDHILDDLVCFHTKLSFEEDVLGVPIKYTTNPATEKVDYISSTLDYVSSTAYYKHNIRRSAFKEDFTHFLPLYISEEHFQRGLPEIKKLLVKLSPEYRSNGFHPSMALSVFGRLMNTMIVIVMEGGIAASEKALNGYIAFHRLLIAFVEMYPQLMVEVNQSIDEFLGSESGRVKSTIPSMGDWLALLSVSNKYTWKHVAKHVVSETFDRNVIWICKENPSLATLADISKSATPGVEHNRLKESFEYSQVSVKLLLFHSYFLSYVARPAGLSVGQVADSYDRYYGRPNSKTLDSFHAAVKRIQGIKGWPDFFALAGLPCPTPVGMTQILRESVRNSKRKGYHTDRTNFRNIQASGTSVLLNRGDSFSAPRNLESVVMKLGWGYLEKKWYLLDAGCFEYTKTGQFVGYTDYARLSNANKSVIHSGDVVDAEKSTVTQTINLTLSKIPATTSYLVFTITAYVDQLNGAKLPWVRMSDGETSSELCQYVLDRTGNHTAVVMCVMHRNPAKSCWDLKVLGKLDEGGAQQAYCPIRVNVGKQLQNGTLFDAV